MFLDIGTSFSVLTSDFNCRRIYIRTWKYSEMETIIINDSHRVWLHLTVFVASVSFSLFHLRSILPSLVAKRWKKEHLQKSIGATVDWGWILPIELLFSFSVPFLAKQKIEKKSSATTKTETQHTVGAPNNENAFDLSKYETRLYVLRRITIFVNRNGCQWHLRHWQFSHWIHCECKSCVKLYLTSSYPFLIDSCVETH